MKNRKLIPFALLLILTSCSRNKIVPPVASSSEDSPIVSSFEKTSSTSSQTSDISSRGEEESRLSKERADYSHLPYLDKVASLKKEKAAWNNAKWIWYSKNPADAYFAFRKVFTLDSVPSKAIVSLSADSKATIWVNGSLAYVDCNIKRGMTQYDSFYSDYDIRKYLKKGKNLIVFEVDYWGRSANSSISSGQGGLLFDINIDDKTHIVSDTSTKVRRIAAYRNKSQLKEKYPSHPTSSFLAEQDVYFDGRLYEDFTTMSYEDSSWDKATLVGNVGYLPFGDTYYCDLPPFDFAKEITWMSDPDHFLNVKTTRDTLMTFALDQNQQFLPYFELESEEEGKVITFYTNTKTTQGVTSFMDDYVTKKGKQSYQQLYYRTGYQFIMEVPAGVTVKKVGYLKTGYPSTKVGSYESDNASLDTLWSKAYNTMNICMRDNYMDCPERERSPYTGDAANQIAETLYSLDENGYKLAKKTYTSLLGWVKDDHIIPTRWPSATTNENPMQNLACIITTYDYYLHTGDRETMKMIYPIYKEYLKLWTMREDGSVEYRDGTFPWVDWGSDYDSEVMEQAWYYWAMGRVLSLGKDIGLLEEKDKTFFENRRRSMKNVFASKYKTDAGFASVVDGKTKERRSVDDRANALAVLSGLAGKEDYPLVGRVLTTVKNASPYMERFVLEALCKMGMKDKAKERMLSRYEGMISYEASTLWEGWSHEADAGTINHGWAGGPLVVMSKYFAGIRPTSGGYATWEIEPAMVSTSYSSSTYTPEGTLSYTLHRQEGVTTIVIQAPNAGGSLILDEAYGSTITLDNSQVTLKNQTLALHKGTNTILIS